MGDLEGVAFDDPSDNFSEEFTLKILEFEHPTRDFYKTRDF